MPSQRQNNAPQADQNSWATSKTTSTSSRTKSKSRHGFALRPMSISRWQDLISRESTSTSRFSGESTVPCPTNCHACCVSQKPFKPLPPLPIPPALSNSDSTRSSWSLSTATSPPSISTPETEYDFNNNNFVTELLRRQYSLYRASRHQKQRESLNLQDTPDEYWHLDNNSEEEELLALELLQPKPRPFINSYSASPRYRREPMDFKHHFGTADFELQDEYDKKHQMNYKSSFDHAQQAAEPYIVARKFFKQYEVRSSSAVSAKNLEICQNGRRVLWCTVHTPFFGAPKIEMGRAGARAAIAAAKFKQIMSGFYINIGHPPDMIPVEQWPQVTYSYWHEKDYFFEFNGRRFSWRSPVSGFIDYLKDNGDFQLIDLENGTILAAFLRAKTGWKLASKAIARIEVYVELDSDLELMALIAIMGVEERRRRAMGAAAGSSAAGGVAAAA